MAALDRLALPVLIADDDRRCLAGNGAAADLLGIPREEIPFDSIDELTAPDRRAAASEQWHAYRLWIYIAPGDGRPEWTAPAPPAGGVRQLTKREREILTLVAHGGRSDDIAGLLHVSPTTVTSHIKNAMRKLGAHTRAHAVALALQSDQITLDE